MKLKTTSTWAPLKSTIFRLHQCAKQRSGQRRRLKDQIRDRDEIIAKLRAEVAYHKGTTQPEPVFNCQYPAQMMVLAVFIVLHGGSLRCAAATIGFYSSELMGWKYKAPTWKTISNWVERCGLHALQLTQDLNGQYVGLSDLTIQVGTRTVFCASSPS